MFRVEESEVYCPYCAEPITVLIDGSVPNQEYIEDCEVCCRPILISYAVLGKDDISISVQQEDE